MDKSLYKAHQKTHMVDKTYHCAKCNKIFFKEVSLLAHQCTGGALLEKREQPVQRTSTHDSNKKHKRDATFSSLPSRNFHVKAHNDAYDNTVCNIRYIVIIRRPRRTSLRLHWNATLQVQQREIKVKTEDESMPKLSPEILEYNVPSIIEPRIEINEQTAPPPIKRTLIKTTNG